MNVRVLGRGKVGRTLHAAFRKAALDSTLHHGRSQPRASRSASVYVLAVPDAQIRATAERIATQIKASDVVIHCSGNRGPEELAPCLRRGASVAVVHPFVSFASAKTPPDLHETTWIARGDERALRVAKRLARAVGARCIEGPSGQAAYHAAAAVVANGSTALADLAVRMLGTLSLDRKVAQVAVAGLLRSVAHNVERVGVPAALTGPVVRGDADTVRSHLVALHAQDPKLAESYRALAPLILACAEASGLSPEPAAAIRKALNTTHRTRATSKGKRAQPRRR